MKWKVEYYDEDPKVQEADFAVVNTLGDLEFRKDAENGPLVAAIRRDIWRSFTQAA